MRSENQGSGEQTGAVDDKNKGKGSKHMLRKNEII
jgi:hypothetical protein